MSKKAVLQGDLDGLCGLYSVINVLNNLLPGTNKDTREELFKHGITWLNKNRSLKNVILKGMQYNTLKELIESYQCYISDNSPFYCKVNKFPDIKDCNARGVWNHISTYLEENKKVAVIIGFQNKSDWDHWTIIQRATGKTWLLCDSAGRRKILKSEITTAEEFYSNKKTHIHPSEIIGLHLEKK